MRNDGISMKNLRGSWSTIEHDKAIENIQVIRGVLKRIWKESTGAREEENSMFPRDSSCTTKTSNPA